MKFDFFKIPKEVWWYAIIPILVLILASFVYWLFYRKNKDTHYYNFNLNYVFQINGVLISAIMLALLLGYSIATIYLIFYYKLLARYYIFMIILIFLPLIPLCTFIWLCFRVHNNMKYKSELDEEIDNEEELKKEVEC